VQRQCQTRLQPSSSFLLWHVSVHVGDPEVSTTTDVATPAVIGATAAVVGEHDDLYDGCDV